MPDDDAATDAALEDALNQVASAEAESETPDESVDESASEGDAAAPEDDDTTAAEEPDETDDTDGDAPAEGSSAFNDLLAKYGGDREKMAEGVWEQARSVSALHRELADIKAIIANQRATPEDEAKIIASDPEVQELAGELAALDNEMQATQQAQTSLIADYGKMDKLIAKLEGQLERADDMDKPDIKASLREAKLDMRQIQRDYQSHKQRLDSLGVQKRQLGRQFKQVELQARARREQAKQQELSQREQARLTRDEFNTACRTEAERFGIDTSSRTFAVLNQSIRDRITAYLRSLPEDSPAIDLPQAVAALMGEYAEVAGLKKRFTQRSQQKRRTVGKTPIGTSARPKGKVPTDKTGKYWDASYARKRAKQLLG
jgi:hypothetical protein